MKLKLRRSTFVFGAIVASIILFKSSVAMADVGSVIKPEYVSSGKESDPYKKGFVYWDVVPGAAYYEIKLIDASGKEYFSSPFYASDASSLNRPNVEYNLGECWYSSEFHSLEFDKYGNYKTENIRPGDYKFFVRSVFAKADSNNKSVLTYSEWSQPIKVTVPDSFADYTDKPITDLSVKYDDEAEKLYLLSSNFAYSNTTQIWMSVYPDFHNSFFMTYGRSLTKSSLESFSGLTVYIAVDQSNYSDTGFQSVLSNIVKYDVPYFDKKPDTLDVKNVKATVDDRNQVKVSFDSKDEKYLIEDYVVEQSTSGDFSENVVRYTNLNTIPLESFDADVKYYFRVRVKSLSYRRFYCDYAGKELTDWLERAKKDSNVECKTKSISNKEYYEFTETVWGNYSDVVSYKRNTSLSSVGKVNVSYKGDNDIYVMFDSLNIDFDESIQYQYSKSKSFPAGRNADDNYKTVTGYWTKSTCLNSVCSISRISDPGVYYIRVRKVKGQQPSDYNNVGKDVEAVKNEYYTGPWSKTMKFTVSPKLDIAYRYVVSYGKTGYISIDDRYSYNSISGYQVEKKTASGWTEVYKGPSQQVLVKDIEPNKIYEFRARAFYYDTVKKKYTYGNWYVQDVFNWSYPLNFKAVPQKTNAIELSWDRIPEAEGYEIYRFEGNYTRNDSQLKSVTGSNGEHSILSSVYCYPSDLIKKLGANAKSYTDKNVKKDKHYLYNIRAYKVVNGRKQYLSDAKTIDMYSNNLGIDSKVQLSDGKLVVKWNRPAGFKKYTIEKQDVYTGNWKKYKTVSKETVTLPAVSKNNKNFCDKYRIIGINGKKVTNYAYVEVYPYLKAPQKVKAKVLSDGAVKISWQKVAGADFYLIRRTKDAFQIKISDKDGYYHSSNSSQVIGYESSEFSASHYREIGFNIKGTSAIDYDPIDFEYDGPTDGGEYFYYVIACKSCGGSKNVYSGDSEYCKVNITNNLVGKPVIKSVTLNNGKAVVKWNKIKDCQGYEIYRSEKRNSGYKLIKSVTKNSTVSYSDTKVKTGKTYYYKIRAVLRNQYGEKTYSIDSDTVQIKIESKKNKKK